MEKKRSRMELKAKSIIGEHEYMGDGEYSVVGFKADKSKYILIRNIWASICLFGTCTCCIWANPMQTYLE